MLKGEIRYSFETRSLCNSRWRYGVQCPPKFNFLILLVFLAFDLFGVVVLQFVLASAIQHSSFQFLYSNCRFDIVCFTIQHCSLKYSIFSNYWMRLSRIWRILQIKEGVIHRGLRPRWITPSEICRILQILPRKPNSIIALLFIQKISSFLKEFRHYALCFSAHQTEHNFVPRFSR